MNVPSPEQAVHGDHRHCTSMQAAVPKHRHWHEARRRDGDHIARLLGSGSEGTVAFVSPGFYIGLCIQPRPKLRVGFGGVDARTYFDVVFCSKRKRRCAATTKVE